ncbi:MAG: hypothetical protein HN348_34085, partial [Proteobacteria bacterium]|nr:hypothetical protein [Pseudomonadota bacterium]
MHLPTPKSPEIRVVVSQRSRVAGVQDMTLAEKAAQRDPPQEEVSSALEPYRAAPRWLLGGGEPTLRVDLPPLLSHLCQSDAPELGLMTDGLALAKPKVVDKLVDVGLSWVRIPFHCGRRDAHDWLVGINGAARLVHRALRNCIKAGLKLEIEILVTRPTMELLVETVQLLSRLEPRAIVFRRPLSRGSAASHFVALSPRFRLLSPHLKEAIAFCRSREMLPLVQGFPHCVA